MRIKIKSEWVGILGHYLAQALKSTLRIKTYHHPDYDPTKQYLFCFWHGKQLLPVLQCVQHQTKRGALVSASRDGSLLEAWLFKLGYDVIRGSSRHQGVSSLKGMVRALKQGYSIGFGVDGPTGPIYQIKPGIIYMAQKLGIEIIPVGSAFSKKWVTKAWDKYEIPKPFARAGYYLGKPIQIAQDACPESSRLELESLMADVEKSASELLQR